MTATDRTDERSAPAHETARLPKSPCTDGEVAEMVRHLKITAAGNPLSRYRDHRAADVEILRQAADLLTRLSAERDRLAEEKDAITKFTNGQIARADNAEAECDALKADMGAAIALLEDPNTLREAAALSVGPPSVRLYDEANEIERLTAKYSELHATLSGERKNG